MRTLYLLACVCLSVSGGELSEEEDRINGENGWYLPFPDGSLKWVDIKTVEAVQSYYNAIDDMDDSKEDVAAAAVAVKPVSSTNGVDGWYVPFVDGSLRWIDMKTVKRIQSYESDVIESANSASNTDADVYPNSIAKEDPVKFWLYSTQNSDKGEKISTNSDIEKSNFNPQYTTIFVAQSFLQTQDSLNLNTTLHKAFSKKGNHNFISIQWLDNFELNYIGASCQVAVAGEHVANLFDTLVQSYGMDCEKTHLIAHGLGAHVIGFAAKYTKSCKVPRITVLDPALALFPFDEPTKRLNNTDARYVESIQTDGGFFGQEEPIGTATFYCNGGRQQPGCNNNNACNHERSIEVFAEAIATSYFPANQCEDYVSAINGSCSDQYSEVCLGDDKNNFGARGIYFVKTNDQSPFGAL